MPGRGEPARAWEVGEDPRVPPAADVVPTAPEQSDRRALVRERRWRWLFTTVLVAFVAVGAAGVLGVRTATTSDAGGDVVARVSFAAVTRPGLATPFEVEVSRRDGAAFDAPVWLAVSAHYLAMFDAHQVSPAPSSEVSGPGEVVWRFDPPLDDGPLRVRLDARVEPGVRWGRDGFVRVLRGDDGATAAEVSFRTWVAP